MYDGEVKSSGDNRDELWMAALTIAIGSEICAMFGLLVVCAVPTIAFEIIRKSGFTDLVQMGAFQTLMLVVYLSLIRHGRVTTYALRAAYSNGWQEARVYYNALVAAENAAVCAYAKPATLLGLAFIGVCSAKISMDLATALLSLAHLSVFDTYPGLAWSAVQAAILHTVTYPLRSIYPPK